MEYSTIFATSWHYRLATVYGPLEDYQLHNGTDICSYVRAVIFGAVCVALWIIAGGLFSLGFGDLLAWIVAGVVYGFVQISETGALFVALTGGLIGALVALVGSILICDKYSEMKRRMSSASTPPSGFVGTAYVAFKNKYCTRVRAEPTARDHS